MDDELNKKLEEYAKRNYTTKSSVIAQGVRSILMTDTILQMFSDVSLAVKQVAEKKKLKIKNHRKLMYECSDTSIATVNKSGVIKGLKKGKCTVYVYARNGMAKKVTVTVK